MAFEFFHVAVTVGRWFVWWNEKLVERQKRSWRLLLGWAQASPPSSQEFAQK